VPVATQPAAPTTAPAPALLPIPRAAPAPESDPNFYIAAGDRALAKDDPNSAVKMMYRAVELDPTRVSSLRTLAISLVAARRFAEVVPIYDSILGMDPNDQTARFNLALALSRVRDFGRAESQYRQLLAQNERSVEAWFNLAMLYQAQGRLEDARQTWLRVIALDGEMASAHGFLGEVYMDLQRPADALESFAKAAKLKPGEPVAWVNLAAAATRAGSYGLAIVAVHKAADIAPQDALFHYHLGEMLLELHRATGKHELLVEAVAAWKKSLEIGLPKNESTKEFAEKFTKDLADKLAKLEAAATTAPTTAPASSK
jgi:tetratricopeptide (TPR) repeat protein